MKTEILYEYFINNKYTKCYIKIIENAIHRNWKRKTAPCYVESHHPLPQCIIANKWKVFLSAREHYVCHLLLVKMTSNVSDKLKLLHALNMMQVTNEFQARNFRFNGKLFEKMRIQMSKILSVQNTGKKLSEETKRKLSQALQGVPKSVETREKMSIASKGKKMPEQTEEHKQKNSESNRGRVFWNNGQRNMRSKTWPGFGWVRGQIVTEEASKNRSEAQKNSTSAPYIRTEEHKRLMSIKVREAKSKLKV